MGEYTYKNLKLQGSLQFLLGPDKFPEMDQLTILSGDENEHLRHHVLHL